MNDRKTNQIFSSSKKPTRTFFNVTSLQPVDAVVRPTFIRNSVIICQALQPLHSYRLLIKFCLLYWTVPCWQAVWRVIFKIRVIFGVLF